MTRLTPAIVGTATIIVIIVLFLAWGFWWTALIVAVVLLGAGIWGMVAVGARSEKR